MRVSLSALVAVPLVTAEYLMLDVSRRNPLPNSGLARRQDFSGTLTQSLLKNEYLINITVGTPPQKLSVTLDTGSADLWVPAISSKPCQQGSCDGGSFNPGASSSYDIIDQGGFNITYDGPGDSDAGNWVEETITVGSSKSITGAIIGVALDGADPHGVMGVGFDTNEASPNPSSNGSYPSVLDHMVEQGLINREAYSLYLNDLNQTTGTICFGCVDSTKYTGDLVALPLQQSVPLSNPDDGQSTGDIGNSSNPVREFMVTLTSVVFTDASGATTKVSPDGYAQSVLLDSGTTETLLTADVFDAIASGMGAVETESTVYVVPCSYSATNATLTYQFGGDDGPSIVVPFSEIIGGEIYDSKKFDSSSGGCNLGMGGPIQGSVILGDTFLRSAYVVFDIANQQAAIAQAAGGQAGTSSIQIIPTGTTIPGVSSTATASGTQLSGAAATSMPAISAAVVSDGKIQTGTPTFNLGSSATASGAHASGTSNAAVVTKAPQAALIGAGLMAGVMLL